MSTEKFSPSTAKVLESLSQGDFLSLGVDHIAYIKPVTLNDRTAWSVNAADGKAISVHLTAHAAAAAARQHELLPIGVH
jgi:hypothetical protein